MVLPCLDLGPSCGHFEPRCRWLWNGNSVHTEAGTPWLVWYWGYLQRPGSSLEEEQSGLRERPGLGPHPSIWPHAAPRGSAQEAGVLRAPSWSPGQGPSGPCGSKPQRRLRSAEVGTAIPTEKPREGPHGPKTLTGGHRSRRELWDLLGRWEAGGERHQPWAAPAFADMAFPQFLRTGRLRLSSWRAMGTPAPLSP